MYRVSFESIEDLANVASMPFACPDNAKNSYYRDHSDRNWVCQDRDIWTVDDVSRHLRTQLFEPGVKRIEKLAQDLSTPTPRSRRRKAYQSDQGDDLDLQRVWQGDLEHAWRATRREQSVGPSRVLIVVDCGASWAVTSEQLAIRGAAALALASRLREAGYTVAITAASDTKLLDRSGEFSAGTRYSAEVCLLAPDQELDIHKLASLIASGLLFRGVLLDHMLKIATTKIHDGIGRSSPLMPDSANTVGYDYVATALENDLNTVENANEWLQKHMNALQGE